MTATREKISDQKLVIRQELNTMQRSVVSHVKSICAKLLGRAVRY